MVSTLVTSGLTANQERRLIELLDKVKQPYSTELFEALARRLPVIGLEAVVLREFDGRLEVLMTARPDNDLIAKWAGKWHIPGTILRNEETIEDGFLRLGEREFGATLVNIRFVYLHFPRGGDRTSNLQLVHVADIAESQPRLGTWFDVEELPEKLIDGHRQIISEVIRRR